MTAHVIPVIGSSYTDNRGQSFEVIGLGTGGVVIEYGDGRAELVDLDNWRSLATNRPTHDAGVSAGPP